MGVTSKKVRKRYYKKNREEILQTQKEHRKQYQGQDIKRQKIRKYVQEYKLSKGCVICGYNKCARVLCFHHSKDKEFGIAQAIANGYSLKKIREEMDKCEILCANCHGELHEKK